MKIDGACHCGYIIYEATIDTGQVGICHCTDCQTLSGSAFRTYVLAPRDDFRLLAGQPKIYVKTGQSGAKRTQAFCPECGTPIYSSASNDPQVFSIRVGTVHQRGELIPKSQIWFRSAQAWLMDFAAIERFAEQPPLRL
ncbi:MAG: GFA family protein [Burkholderiales bacterium]|nr:GFA family protein [Burkholderiales bacterium]